MSAETSDDQMINWQQRKILKAHEDFRPEMICQLFYNLFKHNLIPSNFGIISNVEENKGAGFDCFVEDLLVEFVQLNIPASLVCSYSLRLW